MVYDELAVTIPFDNMVWMDIVDYYFDHVHWDQPIKKYHKPSDWLLDQYGADVDLGQRQIVFASSQRANWFVLTWGQR